MANPDRAGRAIAGLLGYNPGPGIYSRLERAVEQMPESVRVQELPGLLKRYKEGVPGWELKATDLDSTIAGRDVVPRDELLAAVRERSPVYTHGEVILGGRPQMAMDASEGSWSPDYQFPDTGEVSRLGAGVSHGEPRYQDYGQGGKDYAELLIYQPGDRLKDYGSHWEGELKNAVAHARFDTHGDALRINELQSDLGIHNRKARESLAEEMRTGRIRDSKAELPFPLEDAWAEILIKRLALEAARKGHRAIEVASPRAIADKVGGNIDNYEHFYGKVVPGAIERLGRKMGGVVLDSVGPEQVHGGYSVPATRQMAEDALNDLIMEADGYVGSGWGKEQVSSGSLVEDLAAAMRLNSDQMKPALQVRDHLVSLAMENGYPTQAASTLVDNFMPRLMSKAGEVAALADAHSRLWHLHAVGKQAPKLPPQAGRRYIMSDAMRRNLIEKGVGASVLAPLMMQEE